MDSCIAEVVSHVCQVEEPIRWREHKLSERNETIDIPGELLSRHSENEPAVRVIVYVAPQVEVGISTGAFGECENGTIVVDEVCPLLQRP